MKLEPPLPIAFGFSPSVAYFLGQHASSSGGDFVPTNFQNHQLNDRGTTAIK